MLNCCSPDHSCYFRTAAAAYLVCGYVSVLVTYGMRAAADSICVSTSVCAPRRPLDALQETVVCLLAACEAGGPGAWPPVEVRLGAM